jgi:hypothetical protein
MIKWVAQNIGRILFGRQNLINGKQRWKCSNFRFKRCGLLGNVYHLQFMVSHVTYFIQSIDISQPNAASLSIFSYLAASKKGVRGSLVVKALDCKLEGRGSQTR